MIYILATGLVISFTINILFVWYVRELLKKVWSVTGSKKDFWETIENYANHLKSVYEMEMFYGDETLQSLIQHTKYLKEYFDDYKQAEMLLKEEDFAEEEKEVQ